MSGGLDHPAEVVWGMLRPHAEPGTQLAEVEGMSGEGAGASGGQGFQITG